jgi:broad specificity phosphatase PhoE
VPAVLLVRHGQASFGAADYDALSEVGRRQAEIVAAAIAARGLRIDRLASGTLRRQRETAAAFGGLEATVDRRWDEYDPDQILAVHGDTEVRIGTVGDHASPSHLDSRSFQAILEPALDAWIAGGDGGPTEQTWADFRAAGEAALVDLADQARPGGAAVAVTSGGVVAALVGSLLGAPAETFAALNRVVVNASITKLVIGSSGTNLVSFNDHSHLEAVDRALVTYR